MAEIYQLPETGGSNAGVGNIPFSIPIGGNGMFGNGQTNLMDLLGFAIVASIFPNFFGGGYGFGGGGNGAAGFLSNQINNDTGRELIMQAVNNQGEASLTAIQTLSTMLGQDFNLVNGAVSNVQSALQTLALQQAVSVPQIINAIQSGDASLASQFQKCCCDNQLAICQQTNALQSQIAAHDASVRLQLAQNEAADQLSVCQQTNTLTRQSSDNTNAILGAIKDQNAMIVDKFCEIEKRELQGKIDAQGDIITQLRGQIDNDRQTAQLFAALNPLQAKVNEIANKQPNTVPVQYPNLVAVNQTPYGGGYPYYGNGFGGGIVF